MESPAMKKRVLLIDDEARVRTSLKMVLEPNYEILQAADAQEGLDTFRKEGPDLVLLDVILPGTDGLAVLDRFKARRQRSSWDGTLVAQCARTWAEPSRVRHGGPFLPSIRAFTTPAVTASRPPTATAS